MITSIFIGLGISYLVLFILSIFLKDNSIVDIFWGIGFLQIAVHGLIVTKSITITQIVVTLLVVLWSTRISSHILSKKIHKKGEDSRYAIWRKTWKWFYVRSFFQVYVLQAILLIAVATPLFIVNLFPRDVPIPIITIGVTISLFGLIYETIGDLQLKNFLKTRKKNQIMKTGLWHYSRHPNYFGETIFWLGITIIASQISPVAVIGWITITILLRFISGVPPAERSMKGNKEFAEYKKTTPAMIPNAFKKKGA